jgi:SAM-dependent methyltransferase
LFNRLSSSFKLINFTNVPPAWRLPDGVDAGLWEYAHTPRLAAEEDDYFANHPLFRMDPRALEQRFVIPGRLVDLGCGTGRHAIRFARRGFAVTAVDLSRSMLERVGLKVRGEALDLVRCQANLCRLGCFPDKSFDYALSMFSTLGMIRGRASRRRALEEAARILRPGGRLAVHVHNLWLNLRNPAGRAWLRAQALESLFQGRELGDREMTYRGITGMRVHLYRWGELKRELRAAGFRIEEVLPQDAVFAAPIPAPWFAHGFRAGGWIVFASRI